MEEVLAWLDMYLLSQLVSSGRRRLGSMDRRFWIHGCIGCRIDDSTRALYSTRTALPSPRVQQRVGGVGQRGFSNNESFFRERERGVTPTTQLPRQSPNSQLRAKPRLFPPRPPELSFSTAVLTPTKRNPGSADAYVYRVSRRQSWREPYRVALFR